MFGLSFGEILIIAVLALLLLGPDRLPDAAKTLGKGLRDIRKATEDLKDQVEREIYTDDSKKAARPALVPPVPAGPVPGPAGPPPPATSENVPGLEAALAEPPGAEPSAPISTAAAGGVAEPPPEDVAPSAVAPAAPGAAPAVAEGTKS
jgi:sec-independent protein translocase protein TatB